MERGEERFPRRRKAFRDDQKAVPLERKASLGDDENRSREHRRSREDHEGCAPDPDRVRIQDPFASPLQARQRAEDPGLELGQQLVGMKTCRVTPVASRRPCGPANPSRRGKACHAAVRSRARA